MPKEKKYEDLIDIIVGIVDKPLKELNIKERYELAKYYDWEFEILDDADIIEMFNMLDKDSIPKEIKLDDMEIVESFVDIMEEHPKEKIVKVYENKLGGKKAIYEYWKWQSELKYGREKHN